MLMTNLINSNQRGLVIDLLRMLNSDNRTDIERSKERSESSQSESWMLQILEVAKIKDSNSIYLHWNCGCNSIADRVYWYFPASPQ